MHEINFDEALEKIVAKDPRYARDAYFFVRDALDHTVKSMHDKPKHVNGQQLLAGIREFALEQYSPMALTVLNEWGIKCCEDFGDIVFNMVEFQLLGKTEQDSREDFKGGYDFEEAFRKPFLPTKRSITPKPSSLKHV